MKRSVFIVSFIVVMGTLSLYAMEDLEQKTLIEQSSLMNDYGSLTESTLHNIREQSTVEEKKSVDAASYTGKRKHLLGETVAIVSDDEDNASGLIQLSKSIVIGSGYGLCLFGSMTGIMAAIGACLGHGVGFACFPNVLISTVACSGCACLCTAVFGSKKSPCDDVEKEILCEQNYYHIIFLDEQV